MKTVIIIFGNMGHGKDTFASFVRKECPHLTSSKESFADPLKEAVSKIVGIENIKNFSQEQKSEIKVYGKSIRFWLQWFGTDVCRSGIHSDIWVHRFCDTVIQSKSQLITCSDGRFMNELTIPKEILVDRIKVINVKIVRSQAVVDLSHQSEAIVHSMPNSLFDFVAHNNGSIDDLSVIAKQFVNNYIAK